MLTFRWLEEVLLDTAQRGILMLLLPELTINPVEKVLNPAASPCMNEKVLLLLGGAVRSFWSPFGLVLLDHASLGPRLNSLSLN